MSKPVRFSFVCGILSDDGGGRVLVGGRMEGRGECGELVEEEDEDEAGSG